MPMPLTTLRTPLRVAAPAAGSGARGRVQARARFTTNALFGGKCPFSRSASPPPAAASSSPAAAADPTTLFARVGGADAVYAVTSSLFDRLLADATLGHFFDAGTLGKHKAVVASFLNGALGGPNVYKGRNMVDAHVGLVGLEHPRDFGIVAGHLADAMADLSVPADLQAEVMGVVGTLEPQFARVAKARKMIEAMGDE